MVRQAHARVVIVAAGSGRVAAVVTAEQRCAWLALGSKAHEALQDRRQRRRTQQYRVSNTAGDA
jgi:hypothetical protein